MQDLIELTNIVSKKKLMKLSILGQSDSKLDQLYDLIATGTARTDEELADVLYQKPPHHAPYQKLKSKLKNRLIDMVFLIDVNQPVNNLTGRAYQEAWRLWSAANLMLLKGATSTGVEWAEKALKLALQFENVDLVVQITKLLRKYYATWLGNEKKYNEYDQLYKKNLDASIAEAKVEEYYAQLMMHGVKEKSNTQKMGEIGEAYFNELAPFLEQYDTYTIHRFIRYIQVTYLLNQYRWEEVIEASQQALDFFKQKPFELQGTLIGFLNNQMVAYTQLRQFEAGHQKFLESLEVVGDNYSYSWFKINELGLILYLHSKHYQQAYEVCNSVFNNPKFKYQNQYTQETWEIYKMYLHYLIFVNKIEADPANKLFNKVRLGKFLNQVVIFSKDKRGMNIPILIIQIAFMIALKRFDEVFDKMEAIEKYTTRYIRRDDHFRSNCFIKMLLQIPIAGFHRNAVKRYAEKYYKKLRSQPLEIADQSHEIEIIPYEDLWEMALASLDLKIVKLKKR